MTESGDNGAGKTTLLHLICAASQDGAGIARINTEGAVWQEARRKKQEEGRMVWQEKREQRQRDGIETMRTSGTDTLWKLSTGTISVVPKAQIGIFEQNLSTIDYHKTVLDNVMDVSIQQEAVARTILARLLFFENDMKKPASVLSGGERIKLAFAKLFVSKVNLLILDEPTNYLDIPSIEVLEEMFSEYEGTLVFVSHDEAFINSVATDVLEVMDGKLIHHDMPSRK